MDPVVTVEGLRKAYGGVTAAADVTFEVNRGEVFGMVGPNGAGKTPRCMPASPIQQTEALRVLPAEEGYVAAELAHAAAALLGGEVDQTESVGGCLEQVILVTLRDRRRAVANGCCTVTCCSGAPTGRSGCCWRPETENRGWTGADRDHRSRAETGLPS